VKFLSRLADPIMAIYAFIVGLPQTLWEFNAKMLNSKEPESYTRTAGLLTLTCYLAWASFLVFFKSKAITDIDIPLNLAFLIAGLYGLGEYWKSKGGSA